MGARDDATESVSKSIILCCFRRVGRRRRRGAKTPADEAELRGCSSVDQIARTRERAPFAPSALVQCGRLPLLCSWRRSTRAPPWRPPRFRRPLGRLLVDPVDAGLLDVAVAAEGGGEGEHAVACGLVLRRRDDAGTAQQILRPRRRESAEEKRSAVKAAEV